MTLIVASHPDDEVLGCGATIKKLSNTCEVNLLLLGEGRRAGVVDCVKKAADALGIQHYDILDFPDQQYDTVSLLEITQAIEHYISKDLPDTIYTHHRNDLNKDHRITYGAVLTACRIGPVKKIYTFETLSSTEWQYPYVFSPNVWVDVGATIPAKTYAMQMYNTEIREGFHPRSVRGILNQARYRGQQVGCEYAEAFELVREIL